jgi:hypothetical protein
MDYISQGDFGLPFSFGLYLAKNLYAWAFQAGAANLDGIIRLPGRMATVLVFGLFGHLAASYFYIFFSLALVFISFYLFARYFLELSDWRVNAVLSLLFTLNPAFLGNMAKIGLVAAAALLPLALVCLKRFFGARNFTYLIGYLFCLNYSLLHPFTFTVNAVLSVAYAVWWLARSGRVAWRLYAPKLLLAGLVGLLLNMYILLPVLKVGSIDKAALSQELTTTPVDYSGLVQVATAGDFVTAFSLSKNVFKDFDFYAGATQVVFMLGSFGLYALVVGLYLWTERRLPADRKRQFAWMLGLLLVMLLMTTDTPLVSAAIGHLIALPGGWIFRSPLKWQLYAPFFLVATLALLMPYLPTAKRRPLLGLVAVLLVAQSAFLAGDIYHRLLVPRHVQVFPGFMEQGQSGQRMLYASGQKCSMYARDNPVVMTELNQVISSKDWQVKRADQSAIDQINLANYQYLMTCQENGGLDAQINGRFKLVQSYAGGAFHLYANQHPSLAAQAMPVLYRTSDPGGINDKAAFTQRYLGQPFTYVRGQTTVPATDLSQVLSSVTRANLHDSSIDVTLPVKQASTLFIDQPGAKYYQQRQGDQLRISAQPQPGYKPLVGGAPLAVAPTAKGQLGLSYQDSTYRFTNILPNPSFESGLWHKTVDDCFQYDDRPQLAMSLDRQNATDGRQSLVLGAGRHLACTSLQAISIKPGSDFLLSFDYRSDGARTAGYAAVFDDTKFTSYNDQPVVKGGGWQSFSAIIHAPATASHVTLFIYGFPRTDTDSITNTHYDNVSLVEVPAITSRFYLVGAAKPALVTPSVSQQVINPTKRLVNVRGATGNFLLRLDESYSPKWELAIDGKTLPAKAHYKINGYDEGWYIDVTDLCQRQHACRAHAGGGYDLDLALTYGPQRWFYLGAMVSVATLGACLLYMVWQWTRRRVQS